MRPGSAKSGQIAQGLCQEVWTLSAELGSNIMVEIWQKCQWAKKRPRSRSERSGALSIEERPLFKPSKWWVVQDLNL